MCQLPGTSVAPSRTFTVTPSPKRMRVWSQRERYHVEPESTVIVEPLPT